MKLARTEGGSGGRKGHSNMAHWDRTAEIKKSARKARRANDKALARKNDPR